MDTETSGQEWRPRVPRLAAWSLATLATLALGLVLVLLTDDIFVSAVWRHFRWMAFAVFACYVALIVAAWTSVNTRHWVSAGLAVIELALLGPVAAAWSEIGAPLRSVLASLAPLGVAGAAQIGLLWSPRARYPTSLSYVFGLVGFAVVILFMGFNPFDEPTCGLVCFDARPPLAGLLTSEAALGLAAGSGASSAVVAGFTLIQSSRLVPRAVLVSAMLTVVSVSAPPVARWIRWSETPATGTIVLLPFLAALVLSCAVVLAAFRDRRTKTSMQALVAYVTEPITNLPADSQVTSAQFFVPKAERWVDALGRPAAEPGGRAVVVSDTAGPVVRLFLGPGHRSGDLIDAMTPALKLAVKTSQLMAISRANLAEVQASRRRIVATSDAERRRIERDLHDGAQQRLVGAMFYLSLAKARVGTPKAEVGQAADEVGKAIEQLRSLAHGVFPSLISDEGLWAALDELCRSSTVTTELEVSGADDLGLEPAMAAYALVKRALDLANVDLTATNASVKCSKGDRLHLIVEVHDPGWNNTDWIDVVDRIGAVGGSLVTSSVEGQLILEAELPCE